MSIRTPFKAAALALALLTTLTGCGKDTAQPSDHGPAPAPVLTSQTAGLVGDGKLNPGEQCDDGNTVSGDGCSASGTLESGYLCHVPGKPCSLASLCGNGTINSGEACDDGNTTGSGNGCSATCDLSLCGNGTLNNREWPNFDQEICDDGNRFEGDGCSRLCEVEPGFACAGNPARCVKAGVAVFNTGVDDNNRRLESGKDTHWRYAGTGLPSDPDVRSANDWPQEVQTARYMAAPLGAPVCVYQDFMVPSTTNVAQFRLRLATFNDNEFDSAKVNGGNFLPTVISQPGGQPWQKNIIREFGTTAPWRTGLNRIELCNENEESVPNAFRYLFVDAYDDRCGDGKVSLREECDDKNTTSGDGCSATCAVEPPYGCVGEPSVCTKTCGNGQLNAGEQCDDGNPTAGDGCNGSCRVEPGYSCPNPGQVCVKTCGNGTVDPGEQCDDGNAFNADGCTNACIIERGYECAGSPSICGPICGNGRLDSGELCDDGNTRLGDGCSNACTLELGYACPVPGQACVKTCGNGNVEAGEQCDDGNLNPGDGCATECRTEPGYSCSRPASGPSVCQPTCGNGALDANETCDDGNTTVGDGCSQGCSVETGYSCDNTSPPSVCGTICGDGIRAGGEKCDDGNLALGDGCNNTCQVEPGWSCPGAGNVCFQTCGNGTLEAGELCDDGNTANTDGCNGSCQVELGYSCSGAPSVCRTTCGDGVKAASEACDDGNLTNGDGCSSTCQVEVALAKPVISGPDSTTPISNHTPPISGTADPGTTVTVREGSTVVCTATVDASGNWTCTPTTPLPDGPHTVTATATNGGGQSSPVSDPHPFTIDTTAPSKPVITGPDSTKPISNPTPPISGTAEPGTTVTVREGSTVVCTATVNAGGNWSCTPTTPLPDGPHTVTATATDDAGNTSPVSDPHPFTIDTSAPSKPVISGPDSTTPVTTHTPPISGTAEPGTTVTVREGSTVVCTATVNAGGNWSCTPTTPLPDGPHTVTATATDDAGNTSPVSDPHPFTIDTTAPAKPVISGPTGTVATQTPPISGTAEPGTTVTVREGSTVVCTATVNAGGNWSCTPTTPLPDGPHTVTATATDGAGNTSPVSDPDSFTIDTAAPAKPVISGPTGTVATQTPPISGTAEPGTTVTVREGSTVVCTATVNAGGNWSCTPTTPLPDGPHTVTATSTDGAGNTSPVSNPDSFTVDSGAPAAPVITGPASGTTVSTGTPPISGTAEPGTTVTVREGSTVVCTATVDASGHWSCTPTTPLPDGPHTVTATTTDGAGNTSPASNPDSFTVDTTAPAKPVITGPTPGSTVTTGTPPISGTAEPGTTVTVREGSTVVCTATVDASGHWSCTPTTPLPDGPHAVTVTATDGAGNTSPASDPDPFTVDATPVAAPVITGPTPGSVLATSTPAISGTSEPGATVTVREGSTVVCTAVVNDQGKWSCTPTAPMADGPHAVTATATDAAGNGSPVSNTDAFRIDTQAPDTSYSSTPPSRTDDDSSPFGYASSETGVTYECSLDGGEYGPCQDSYDVDAGEHTLHVRAKDAAGNVDPTPAEYTWVVQFTRAFAGGGCSAAPDPSWLALLGLLGLRRRKQRR